MKLARRVSVLFLAAVLMVFAPLDSFSSAFTAWGADMEAVDDVELPYDFNMIPLGPLYDGSFPDGFERFDPEYAGSYPAVPLSDEYGIAPAAIVIDDVIILIIGGLFLVVMASLGMYTTRNTSVRQMSEDFINDWTILDGGGGGNKPDLKTLLTVGVVGGIFMNAEIKDKYGIDLFSMLQNYLLGNYQDYDFTGDYVIEWSPLDALKEFGAYEEYMKYIGVFSLEEGYADFLKRMENPGQPFLITNKSFLFPDDNNFLSIYLFNSDANIYTRTGVENSFVIQYPVSVYCVLPRDSYPYFYRNDRGNYNNYFSSSLVLSNCFVNAKNHDLSFLSSWSSVKLLGKPALPGVPDPEAVPSPEQVAVPNLDTVIQAAEDASVQTGAHQATSQEVMDAVNAALEVPDSALDPDPGVDPDPDPAPDPDPDPNPDPDIDTSESSDPDNWKVPLEFKNKFPFSIPWDLYACLSVLQADAIEPVWEVPFVVDNEYIHIRESIVLDLSTKQWSSVIAVIRGFLLLIYIFGLAFVTRQLIKG